MNKTMDALNNERGSVIIVVLLLMTILTLVGLSANRTTVTELKIAANEQFQKMAFNTADGGLFPATKLLSATLTAGAAPEKSDFLGIDYKNYYDGFDEDVDFIEYLSDDDDPDATDDDKLNLFFREVMGFDAYDDEDDVAFNFVNPLPLPDDDDPDDPVKDADMFGQYSARIDMRRMRADFLEGGGVEFASGAEGVGAGTLGGVMIIYDIRSTGEGPRSARSVVDAVYRKITGIPGGL